MKRISGGQLSRKAKATLLSSHAGDPRAATGDTSFASQAEQSTQHSRVSPPPARGPTGRVGRHRPDPETMTVTALSVVSAGSSDPFAQKQEGHPDRWISINGLADAGPTRMFDGSERLRTEWPIGIRRGIEMKANARCVGLPLSRPGRMSTAGLTSS